MKRSSTARDAAAGGGVQSLRRPPEQPGCCFVPASKAPASGRTPNGQRADSARRQSHRIKPHPWELGMTITTTPGTLPDPTGSTADLETETCTLDISSSLPKWQGPHHSGT
ncbi:hypothetical protein NPS01_20960 [Nocardioides psychrotolerans]|nr:hypothetical protein NPS01_20960 [Nocardioides psychrotolerans]